MKCFQGLPLILLSAPQAANASDANLQLLHKAIGADARKLVQNTSELTGSMLSFRRFRPQ